jgi:ketosteroid isomerase-like protein
LSAHENKRLVAHAFEAMGRSDIAPLVDLMTDDFAWIVEGKSKFSRRFDGKSEVEEALLRPLFDTFATPYRFEIEEIIAEGDRVVVLGRGQVRTKWGKDYDNHYCFVIRMANNRMVELREYLDTALVEAVFGKDRELDSRQSPKHEPGVDVIR